MSDTTETPNPPARRKRKAIDVMAWLREGLYLPPVLRDFHDQKDIFKAIDDLPEDPKAMIRRPDFVSAQCYVIDCFLWYMARRGYTLQRVPNPGDFDGLRDLSADVKAAADKRSEAFGQMLSSHLQSRNAETTK